MARRERARPVLPPVLVARDHLNLALLEAYDALDDGCPELAAAVLRRARGAWRGGPSVLIDTATPTLIEAARHGAAALRNAAGSAGLFVR